MLFSAIKEKKDEKSQIENENNTQTQNNHIWSHWIALFLYIATATYTSTSAANSSDLGTINTAAAIVVAVVLPSIENVIILPPWRDIKSFSFFLLLLHLYNNTKVNVFFSSSLFEHVTQYKSNNLNIHATHKRTALALASNWKY